jgi:acyl-CoA synthetase (AMP-forming)/AMP-acid ligase II
VVCKADATISFDDMVSFLKTAQLSVHKIPEQLEIVTALPRNPSGKVLKKDLRATYGGAS